MTIPFNEIKRRYDVIKASDSTATRGEIETLVKASIGMTADEFDALVFQAKVDIVVQKALSSVEAVAESAVEASGAVDASGLDITTQILKAKYGKGAK
jgi:hypothetical protein